MSEEHVATADGALDAVDGALDGAVDDLVDDAVGVLLLLVFFLM